MPLSYTVQYRAKGSATWLDTGLVLTPGVGNAITFNLNNTVLGAGKIVNGTTYETRIGRMTGALDYTSVSAWSNIQEATPNATSTDNNVLDVPINFNTGSSGNDITGTTTRSSGKVRLHFSRANWIWATVDYTSGTAKKYGVLKATGSLPSGYTEDTSIIQKVDNFTVDVFLPSSVAMTITVEAAGGSTVSITLVALA